MSDFLKVINLHKTFVEGKIKTLVLKGVTLEVRAGEVFAILGASGSGKSTFLQILGGLQSFDVGEITFGQQQYSKSDDQAMTILRETSYGFVYQFHHLLGELSALENVMVPLMIRKLDKISCEKQAKSMLDAVGLSHRLSHKPAELSGGERQRVALARAMVKKPQILFADEPTGNLDRHSSEKMLELMLLMNKEFNTTVIFITHDEKLANHAHRVMQMVDGRFI